MRTRKVLAAALFAGFALVALAGPVAAQETTPTTTQITGECIDKLEAGGTADDCQKAPSPIKPATNELIWGAISFAVLLGLLWKFAYPSIKKGMEDRTARIQGSVDDAEAAKNEAQSVLDDYRRQLADARNESARIIEEARQQAEALKKDQEARLQSDLAEMRSRAAADVESAKAQAIADLRADVANLAIDAAQLVVQRNLDRDTQIQLIENYINQVGSAS